MSQKYEFMKCCECDGVFPVISTGALPADWKCSGCSGDYRVELWSSVPGRQSPAIVVTCGNKSHVLMFVSQERWPAVVAALGGAEIRQEGLKNAFGILEEMRMSQLN